MTGVAYHEQVQDAPFRQAIAFMDAGDVDGLRAHVRAHPHVLRDRAELGDEGYFSTPFLLEFIAENPIRHGTMPGNVVDVAKVLIEEGVSGDALTSALVLVSSGRIARESGQQAALIAEMCSAGADPDAAMLAALGHGEFEAVAALRAAGAALTLPCVAAMGETSETERLLPSATPLERHQALALAAQHGQAASLGLLLTAGEDPNRYNPQGCHAHTPPIHQAVFSGHLDCVQALLDAGADPDMKDKNHDATALSWAEHAGHADIFAVLSTRTSGTS